MTVATPTSPHRLLSTERRLVIAHRGGSLLRPENTLAAFDHAAALGVDGFELDVHLAADGEVVVCHDALLERTTAESGPLAALTAEQLARIDAGYRFEDDGRYTYRGQGIGIPRLRQVLERYPSHGLIVELKGTDPALGRAAVRIVTEAGALDRVCFGGFSHRVVRAARAAGPEVTTSASTADVRWALFAARIGIPPPRPSYEACVVPERFGGTTIVSPRFVHLMRRAGRPVFVWTVDDPADMRRLLSWGVAAVISDRPDLALEVVREWERNR